MSGAKTLPQIRVGPAGWSYPDWAGYAYPSPKPKGFHEATYLAEFFDTIEINTSFYNPIRPDHAVQWIERVAANPRVVFTATFCAPRANSALCCCSSLFRFIERVRPSLILRCF